jgi:hypothetical protein
MLNDEAFVRNGSAGILPTSDCIRRGGLRRHKRGVDVLRNTACRRWLVDAGASSLNLVAVKDAIVLPGIF